MTTSSIDPLRGSNPITSVGTSQESVKQPHTENVSPTGETRAQKLERLRQQIADGSYVIDAGQLAQKLLETHILD